MADHLAAVDEVRRRPFCFAFLLVEEAFLLAWDGKTPIPLESDQVSPDPPSRARAIYKRAMLTAYLAARLEPDLPKVRPILETPAAGGERFWSTSSGRGRSPPQFAASGIVGAFRIGARPRP